MTPTTVRPTPREEWANCISHGLGLLFGLFAVPVLISSALANGSWVALIGSIVYGLSFLMVFAFSTLYHGFRHPRLKKILQTLDHISIYFLIAGSYTPFILTHVYNITGLTVLWILWGLTFIGIIFKIFYTEKFELLSTGIYLVMGWMLLPVAKTFFASLPPEVIHLIIAGGALYTIGVIFFLWEKLRYNHMVWHLFVLAAGICHYLAVWIIVS